jgi:glycosyltransferase involved in cell wall biosynthesis
VRHADVVVANAEDVARIFETSRPGRSIVVIRNGLPMRTVPRSRKTHVIWVSRFDKQKRPDVFVRLAKELPDIQFIMCGDGPLHEECTTMANGATNLFFGGWVDERSKVKWLSSAFAFVSTSSSEGFPNTLIEAGIFSTPYISFVDPDEVICRNRLGFHVKSFSELVNKTKLLANDRDLRTKIGYNIRQYVEREHEIEKTVTGYVSVFGSLLKNSANR